MDLRRSPASLAARWIVPVWAAFLYASGALHAEGTERVRVQLKWHQQFQSAGFYAAVEKGYYREAGLDVELLEGEPGMDPATVVLSGKAEFGVGTANLLLLYAHGSPLVTLGVIFQHSPYMFLALQDSGIYDIHDLIGKRVMIEPEAAELYAYLRREMVPEGGLKILPHTFSVDDLLNRKVDAMSAYSTDEAFSLPLLNGSVPYSVFSPRSAHVDFYGDCFFTTRDEIQKYPKRVLAFYQATVRGWEYAMAHTDEVADLMISRRRSQKSREALRFEATQMQDLIHPDIIPIGYMYTGRWKRIMDTFHELGMLEKPVPLGPFLYDPNPGPDYTWLYWLLAGTLLCAVTGFAILLPIWWLNVKLRREATARARVERELRLESERLALATQAKTDFLSQVSHDLRTPLNAILVFSEIMLDDRPDPKLRESLGIVHEAGKSLLRLVNDLLDMNRIEAGRADLEDAPFLLDDVLDPVAALLRVTAWRKGLELAHWIEPGLSGAMRGDAGRLRQMLFNLAGNAVKFTQSGQVSVRAQRSVQGWLRIEVADTGPGIPASALPGLFEPFARAENVRTTEGSGLGLAIVRRFAEAMGGTVTARNGATVGAVFTLQLPIIDDSAGSEEIKSLSARLAGIGVAVSIGDPLVAEAVGKGLESLGAVVGEGEILVTDSAGSDGEQAKRRLVIVAGAKRDTGNASVPLTRRAIAAAILQIPAPAKNPSTPASHAQWHVLVVDDDPYSLEAIAALINRNGCTVDKASGGTEALESLAQTSYDFVFLDGQMPDIDGIEVTRRVRALESSHAGVPIFGLTADPSAERRARWLEAGANAVFGKPLQSAELFRAMDELAAGRRA